MLPAVDLPMPTAEKSAERRRLSGEKLRDIMMDAIMQARPNITLYEAFYKECLSLVVSVLFISDINMKEDSYQGLLKKY